MRSKNDWWDYLEHRIRSDSELYHHGVLGQKWGIRRYQSYSTVPRKSGKGGIEIGDIKKQDISGNTGFTKVRDPSEWWRGDPLEPADRTIQQVTRRIEEDGSEVYPPVAFEIQKGQLNIHSMCGVTTCKLLIINHLLLL